MMLRRSKAREVALQLLFRREANPPIDRAADELFARVRLRDPALEQFALRLVDGVATQATEIDRRLSEAADNWRLHRMAAVERNVLRLGAYELLHTPETPAPAVLDEAIELARRFGGADAPAFVNGVLDRLHRSLSPS